MKRYSIIHPLYLSFFSRALYQDVARNWKGFCLTYLLSLLALCTLPSVLKFQAAVSGFLQDEAPFLISQLPDITIKEGNVSVEGQQPYVIRGEKTGKPFIIIDTTGEISSLKDSPAMILLRKSALEIRQDEAETETIELSGIESFIIRRSGAFAFADFLNRWLVFFTYPFAVIFSLAYHVLVVALLGLIGMIYSSALKIPFRYQALVRLAAIAITPVTIANAVFVLTDTAVPHWWLLGFFITAGYLFYGIRASEGSAPSTAA